MLIDVKDYISNRRSECFGGGECKALKNKESLGRMLVGHTWAGQQADRDCEIRKGLTVIEV